jgi:Phosphoesterase family
VGRHSRSNRLPRCLLQAVEEISRDGPGAIELRPGLYEALVGEVERPEVAWDALQFADLRPVDGQGYGLRVPGLAICPYARKGYIDHQVLSFDAYLKFVEDDSWGGSGSTRERTGGLIPAPMSERMLEYWGIWFGTSTSRRSLALP